MDTKQYLLIAFITAVSMNGWSQSLTPIDAGFSQTEELQLSWFFGRDLCIYTSHFRFSLDRGLSSANHQDFSSTAYHWRSSDRPISQSDILAD